ncbi:hypothetical protein [Chelatococcus reniformis]|uniref:Uncharacterized protein n=1 Tax=Chelatococcus reniformis TaxID=1494448 RepID=A0A916UND5_9HYPH|nr:hypothetical protein [Chelatococcus reniformis]GGC78952.1 hypothetical protein GCM10010994_41380 [Chelatococcus reniformis]
MSLLLAFPFLVLVVVAYNVLIVFGTGTLDTIVGHLALPSGGGWNITTGDTMLIVALALLFVEMISLGSRTATMVNHALSLVLLIVCIAEFLLVPKCGTSVFLLLTVIILVDVLAGYLISRRGARQEGVPAPA